MKNLLLSVCTNKQKRIIELFHIFYFDTQKGYWEKSQLERKDDIFSFIQVGGKMRARNSYGRVQLLEECVAIHRITTSRASELTLLWKNEGAQWKYFQTSYLSLPFGNYFALIPLFEFHQCFSLLFLNSANIFKCLLSVLHCSMHWRC